MRTHLLALIWPAVTVLLVALIWMIDEAAGRDYGIFVFYFVPVAVAAWTVGAEWAIGISLLSAVAWFSSDALVGDLPGSMRVSVWNSLVRLIAFVSIGWTTARIRLLLDRERRITEDLARTLDEVRVLKGLLPVCAWCSRIRSESGQWETLDTYIAHNTDAEVTHGMCDACAEAVLDREGSPTP